MDQMPLPSLLISCQSLLGSQLCHVFPSLLFFSRLWNSVKKNHLRTYPQLWGKTKHQTISSILFIDSQKFIRAMVCLASSLPLPWNSVGSLQQTSYFDKQNCSSFEAHTKTLTWETVKNIGTSDTFWLVSLNFLYLFAKDSHFLMGCLSWELSCDMCQNPCILHRLQYCWYFLGVSGERWAAATGGIGVVAGLAGHRALDNRNGHLLILTWGDAYLCCGQRAPQTSRGRTYKKRWKLIIKHKWRFLSKKISCLSDLQIE